MHHSEQRGLEAFGYLLPLCRHVRVGQQADLIGMERVEFAAERHNEAVVCLRRFFGDRASEGEIGMCLVAVVDRRVVDADFEVGDFGPARGSFGTGGSQFSTRMDMCERRFG